MQLFLPHIVKFESGVCVDPASVFIVGWTFTFYIQHSHLHNLYVNVYFI